ncbi:MAG: Hsp20/alpha crystallin family protein [Myxococcota bacterium]
MTTEQFARAGRTCAPKVDIVESDSGLRLWADLPGVDEGSLQVELVDGLLSIRGRVAADELENLQPVHTEYAVADFDARFRLSNAIDGERIRAKLRHGVLELELPKVASAQPRRIEVSA